MVKKVSLSGKQLTLAQIADHYKDVESAIRLYYSPSTADPMRFAGYSFREMSDELELRLAEEDLLNVFSLLSAIEAWFRVDTELRVRKKLKDALSDRVRKVYKQKGKYMSLEDDIFTAWSDCGFLPKAVISDLKGAFKFRHWLAHGRYWTPKLGQRYDYHSVYDLALDVAGGIPPF
ncbi:MAG: hypothetical protein WC028_16685 [Candidatus Obscuribacterales bacterium]|jgi:uncharacterized protein YutE (UPF0331/DUF86 family)